MHVPTVCWETEQETVKKLKAKKKGEGDQLAFCTPDFVSMVICSFPGLGRVPSGLSLSGETAADSGAPSTARDPWGGDRHRHCCSESTLQDDVVAVIAFCF